MSLGRVGVLSLEPWDDVWRRNQHFASRLVSDGHADSVVFVEPPAGGLALRAVRRRPWPGVETITPPLIVPRRMGGHRVLAVWLRRALADIDVLWINDPVAGLGALRRGVPAVYDVTDDWRSMPQSSADRARIVAAEDTLANAATTVVCSSELAARWKQRYGVDPVVVQNGVDVAAIRSALPVTLPGDAPHAVYVGTIHANRLDIGLVAELAGAWPGTVHLIGPESLPADARATLTNAGVRIPGRITSEQVPAHLIAADVLICPHLVDDFTLSLDAIKSHEYLATPLPVVATASSGFQSMIADGLSTPVRSEFVPTVTRARGTGPFERDVAIDWRGRTQEFADVARSAAG